MTPLSSVNLGLVLGPSHGPLGPQPVRAAMAAVETVGLLVGCHRPGLAEIIILLVCPGKSSRNDVPGIGDIDVSIIE